MIVLFCTAAGQVNHLKAPATVPELQKTMPQMSGHSEPSTQIILRCRPTIDYSNQPLFVIDGILWDAAAIKSLNPDDIEEIHVLKESAATTLYGCRAMRGVIIITTKKALHRKLVIRDAKNLAGIGSATIKAVSEKTGKQFQFTADEFGRIETDSLKSVEYTITISSTGYKTKTIGLKAVLQNKGEITLEREFVELKEVMILGYPTIRCRSMSSTCLPASLYGGTGCPGHGISVAKQKQTTKQSFNTNLEAQIYPNPVAATGSINISFPDAIPGVYQIRFLNAAGQLFYTVQKNSSKHETEQIQLSGKLIPGVYAVQIVNEKKQLLHSSKLLVR